jgi:hypothetical protein
VTRQPLLYISLERLTTPVLLVTIATNSSEARFSTGPSKCYIKKATEKLVNLSLPQLTFEVSLGQLVFGVSQCSAVSPRSVTSVQCSSDSRIQGATSAIVFTVIVTLVAAVNCHSK